MKIIEILGGVGAVLESLFNKVAGLRPAKF